MRGIAARRGFHHRVALVALLTAAAGLPASAQSRDRPTRDSQPSLAPQVNPLSAEAYLRPPEALARLIDAPRSRNVTLTNLSPTRQYFAILRTDGLPLLRDLARPYLNLAGVEVDPAANRARALGTRPASGIDILQWAGGRTISVELPAGAHPANPVWSPDGKSLAYLAVFDSATHIYVADPASGKSRPVTRTGLLATSVIDFRWTEDSKSIIAVLLPAARGPAPSASRASPGPLVRTHEGSDVLRTPTYRDESLLQSPSDAEALEYYLTGQVAVIDIATRIERRVGAPAMIQSLDASPDARGFRVTLIERPFSYYVPLANFGTSDQIWDANGQRAALIVRHPLREGLDRDFSLVDPALLASSSRDNVPAAPDTSLRSLAWNPSGPGLVYLQLEPRAIAVLRRDSTQRDRLMQWTPPFDSASRRILYISEGHIADPRFSADGSLVFFNETIASGTREVALSLRHGHTLVLGARAGRGRNGPTGPINLVMVPGPRGLPVAMMSPDGRYVFTQGTRGADRDGNGAMAYVDRIDVISGIRDRVYQSDRDGSMESIATPLNADYTLMLVQRGSASVYPQAFARDVKTGTLVQLTKNVDPTPEMAGVVHRTVTARRPDGYSFQVRVTLPPGYEAGTRLPALFWFYPREYDSQEIYDRLLEGNVTQVGMYPTYGPRSWAFITLFGYALIEPDAPIFGRPGLLPNDSYVVDLESDLAATIDALDTLGIIDRQRLGIGGHSYGAFSAVNAMVHTQYFKAGIAGDGAYNRTLTPNGFQSERRDLWQATQTYLDMSPFLYANRLTGALLLYHSLDDQNVGTDPINSTRLYQALQALGKTVSLYLYPYEDHTPMARETILDQWARWIAWLDKYVKNAEPTASGN